jgi:hypothetical protein
VGFVLVDEESVTENQGARTRGNLKPLTKT